MNNIEELADQLEEMYGKPIWESSIPLLDELILTILSQNTSSKNYTQAFNNLKARFADWKSVAEAPVDVVADAIRTGGLANIKAPRIQAILEFINAEQNEYSLEFIREMNPWDAYRFMQTLPGVGPKTAACVLMFGLGLPIFPVDTHIRRISQRLGLVPSGTSAEKTQAILQSEIPPERIYSFHINLVNHGRRTCKAAQTACQRCLLYSCPSRGIYKDQNRR
jgi:endonuclease-3